MDKIELLKKDYEAIVDLDNVSQISATDGFIEKLLKDNCIEMLDYHFSLLQEKGLRNLYNRLRAAFSKRPKDVIEQYLLKRLNSVNKEDNISDIIHLLGNIKSVEALTFAKRYITSYSLEIRYKSIIVIGWLGNADDIAILNERLLHDPDDLLRGYAATAMRQIWYKDGSTKEKILPYLYEAIKSEESLVTLPLIIIVIQDLMKMKFGLQEKINDGIITGDVLKAKNKVLKYISK